MDGGLVHNYRVVPDRLRKVLARNILSYMGKIPGMGQEELERRSGLAQASISRILACQGDATLKSLAKLAKGLGVQPWELLVDEEETRREAMARMLAPIAQGRQDRP